MGAVRQSSPAPSPRRCCCSTLSSLLTSAFDIRLSAISSWLERRWMAFTLPKPPLPDHQPKQKATGTRPGAHQTGERRSGTEGNRSEWGRSGCRAVIHSPCVRSGFRFVSFRCWRLCALQCAADGPTTFSSVKCERSMCVGFGGGSGGDEHIPPMATQRSQRRRDQIRCRGAEQRGRGRRRDGARRNQQ